MNNETINAYWQSVLHQNANDMRTYFHKEAMIRWHNTLEQFTVEEFITANCTYPGTWQGSIERIERSQDIIIVVAHVYCDDASFHVTSFMKCDQEQIVSIDEYWGDDGEAPTWRKQLQIGTPLL